MVLKLCCNYYVIVKLTLFSHVKLSFLHWIFLLHTSACSWHGFKSACSGILLLYFGSFPTSLSIQPTALCIKSCCRIEGFLKILRVSWNLLFLKNNKLRWLQFAIPINFLKLLIIILNLLACLGGIFPQYLGLINPLNPSYSLTLYFLGTDWRLHLDYF